MRPHQSGGRLVGKGSYACSFSPPPACATGSGSGGAGDIGKVSIQDMSEEADIGRTLMRLPRAADYFAVPTSICVPTLPITDPDAGRCPVLRKKGPFSLSRMTDAGVPLSRWGIHAHPRAERGKGVTEAALETQVRHLLEGMVLYQSAGIVHNDIHWGNVLVDPSGRGRYIDFGQAYRVADLRVWEDLRLGRRFLAEYIWIAPELQSLRIRATYGSGEDERGLAGIHDATDHLYAKTPEYRQLETEYPHRTTLRTVLREFPGKVGDEDAVIAYMRAGGAPRIDWWRLGVCLWALWRKTGQRSAILRRVIGGLTEFDPAVRMSPATALRIFGSRRQTQKRPGRVSTHRKTYSRSYIERRR